MIAFALLLLLAAARVELVDETFRIPPGEWRYIDDVHLQQHPVLVAADYAVRNGGPGIRLLLMRREDVERLRSEEPHGALAATAHGPAGSVRFTVPAAGHYAVVLDNREGKEAAEVHLRVALEFGGGPAVKYLDRRRQLAVILLSFAFFFAVVTWSARRILRAIKQ